MAKIKLGAIKDGKDKNQYCGPAVISALTDLTTGEAARLIRKQSGCRKVTGTSTTQVLRALNACGIGHRGINVRYPLLPSETPWSNKPTLARWLKMSKKDRTEGRVFLIAAGHHWQLVSGRRYTCGRIREIVSIKDKQVKRRARVAEVYELTSNNVIRPRDIDVSKPKSKSNPVYYQVRKLIKKYPEFEITCEKDDIDYWVTMSRELEDLATEMNHDLCDEHYCGDIYVVKRRVEEMVAFGKEYYPTVIAGDRWRLISNR